MDRWTSKCGLMELRLGDYRDVLDDVKECQSVITDPPYSKRTHDGDDAKQYNAERLAACGVEGSLTYSHFTDDNVKELIARFAPITANWHCCFSDHVLIPVYQRAYELRDLYSFAPLPCVTKGSTVRLGGDGPASWATYLNVARTRSRESVTWGALPGAYVVGVNPDRALHYGGKSILLMRQIVRDYSRKGALVVDPCAGAATTLLACAIEGRRCIGSEIDGETFEKAIKRLEKGYTPLLME